MSDLKSQRVPRARWREVVPPLPKDHAAALGQVAANWSAIDAYCALIIAFWLDIEHVREAVTAELSLMQKIGIITALAYETRDQRLVDHWQDMLTNLDRLRVTRNDAVHGEWRDVGGEHYLATITAKRRVSFKFRPFSTQELLALESEMLGMLDQLVS